MATSPMRSLPASARLPEGGTSVNVEASSRYFVAKTCSMEATFFRSLTESLNEQSCSVDRRNKVMRRPSMAAIAAPDKL